jgi:hypothetical protein
MVGVIEITPELAKRHTPAERTWFGLGGMDPGPPNFSPAEFTRSDRIEDEAGEIHRTIQWTSLRGGISAKQRPTGTRGAAPLLRFIDIQRGTARLRSGINRRDKSTERR